ncbi:MAG TPA: penicillin-binding transpeptidase domain-containing protein [Geobacteraceae bacterium]|nr:penicillin-binding transpeptidase domain-containing protein [Geobacteraceae bacterium]
MRDIKNITSRKRLARFRLFQLRRRPSNNSYRTLTEAKPAQRRLRFLLPAMALLLAAYPVVSLITSARNAVSSVAPAPPPKVKPYSPLDPYKSFQLAADSLPALSPQGENFVAPLPDGGTIIYSIDQDLQERVQKVMASYQVPYGAFVAVEPKTGRILAIAGHSTIDPRWKERAYFNVYPMASLFKIITAAAALEEKKVSADTVFAYRGKLTSVNPKYWSVRPGRGNQEMSLATAMGKSVNPVFGRLASDVVGRTSIMSSVERFGFNQPLLPGTSITPSKAAPPQNDMELMLMGAGLGREVKVSPFHAALMMAAIANDGVMMLPSLANQIKNGKGETIFSLTPQTARRMVTPETAAQLARMLSTTVSTGTSRRAFHDKRGRPKLASVNIAAKTGTIDGKDPAGHYSWFAAYAPINDPQIALVALIINQDKWRIKASYVGEQALEAFFK